MQDGTPGTPPSSLRPWVAAFASAVVPGLGQLLTGRRRRGAVLLAITGTLLVASAWLTVSRRWVLLRWFVEPEALTWLLIGNGLVLGFRVFAAADAFLGAGDGSRPRGRIAPLAATVGVLIAGLLAIPHAVAGYADVTQYDLITSVFAPAPTTTTLPPTSTAAPPSTSEATGPPTTLAAAATTTIPAPVRLWEGSERINILLLGGDARPSSTTVRTDTTILASIDPRSGHIAMFSIPRNMAQVPLPDSIDIWRCDCFPGIINALWRYGDEHPESFPALGIPAGAVAMKAAVGELTGLEVHYYALVNLTGFVEIVDAVGGVDITVPRPLYDADYGTEDGVTREIIDIPAGEHHMDGHMALAYARSRRSSDDYHRMGRQRCVLQALAAQSDPVTVIRTFPTIAAAIKKNLSTDVPIEALPDFIEILPRVDADAIVSIRFVPNQFTGPRTKEGYNTPDLDAIRHAVDVALSMPPAEALATLGLEDAAEECG